LTYYVHVVFTHRVELIFVSNRLIEIEEVLVLKLNWFATRMPEDLHSHCIGVKYSQVLALILLHHVFLIIVSGHVDVTSEYQNLIRRDRN
jgi:hypothetical protein